MMKGSEARSVLTTTDYRIQMRIRDAQKHTDPMDPDTDADPDPQHCLVRPSSLDHILYM